MKAMWKAQMPRQSQLFVVGLVMSLRPYFIAAVSTRPIASDVGLGMHPDSKLNKTWRDMKAV